jgi:hypothetical protein
MRTTCNRILGVLLIAATSMSACAKRPQQPTTNDVSQTIKSFMAIPTEADAEALVRLLDNREVSAEQGNEILSLLRSPSVVVRSSYSVKKGAGCVLVYPTRIHFSKLRSRQTIRSIVNDEFYCGSSGGGNSYGEECITGVDPCSSLVAKELKSLPQTIMLIHEEKIELIPESEWDSKSPTVVYSCTSRTYIPIRFVSEQEAESIHVFTDPNLDAKMRSTFYAKQRYWSFSNGQPNVKMTGDAVCFKMLPADVTFRKMFRDESGQLLDIFDNTPGAVIRERAGTSRPEGCFMPSVNRQLKEFPLAKGKHEGHIVLIADPEGAYSDPRFTHIWGGILELPFTLIVQENDGKLP